MSNLEIWLLAVCLAMDCFTVSVTSGIILRRVCWRTCLIMAFFFGFFQAAMPLIGWFCASRFNSLIESFDHWIAFGLLTFLGIRMIKEGLGDDDKCCFDPHKLKVVLTLAVATSIDALAVGISFACTGMNPLTSILSPIFIIGLVSFVLSIVGQLLGVYFGRRVNLRSEVLGGFILIAIGVKILMEHLHLMEL